MNSAATHAIFIAGWLNHAQARGFRVFDRQWDNNAMRSTVLAASLGLVAFAATASAAPPPNADPALSPWFEDLRQPGTGRSCCSVADCRPVDYRIIHNHYEAFVGQQWVEVPEDKVLHRFDNPTGRAVACWTPALGIICFVEGPGT